MKSDLGSSPDQPGPIWGSLWDVFLVFSFSHYQLKLEPSWSVTNTLHAGSPGPSIQTIPGGKWYQDRARYHGKVRTHDEGEKDLKEVRTLLRWDQSASHASPHMMREKKTCFIHISYNTHLCNIPSTAISKYTYVRLFRAICITSVGLGGEFFNFGVVPPAIGRKCA